MQHALPYAEVCWWARYLSIFTARDLANAMGVNVAVGERGLLALLDQGCCEDTGDDLDGPYGPERIIRYVPLPPGPRFHPRELPPEIAVPRSLGGDPLKVPRGMPVAARGRERARRSRVGNWHPGRHGPEPKKE